MRRISPIPRTLGTRPMFAILGRLAPRSEPEPTEAPRERRCSRALSWLAAGLAGVVLLCTAAVPLAGAAWVLSLLAQLAAHVAALAAVGFVAAASLRRWRLATLLAGCLAVHGAILLSGRTPRSPGAPQLSLLVHNTHTANTDLAAVIREVRGSGADVVVLVEPAPDLVRLLRREEPLADIYPHVLMRGPSPDRTTWRIVLSRWPLEDRRTRDEMCCLVRAPTGSFALIAIHPASPRDAGRWRTGNQLVRAAAGMARALAAEGLPVIVAGDLNSTPSGWRSRGLRRQGGLSRCKPLWCSGSYPAGAPAPARLALDDAWVSADWRLCSWGTSDAAGSDHRAVHLTLRLAEP